MPPTTSHPAVRPLPIPKTVGVPAAIFIGALYEYFVVSPSFPRQSSADAKQRKTGSLTRRISNNLSISRLTWGRKKILKRGQSFEQFIDLTAYLYKKKIETRTSSTEQTQFEKKHRRTMWALWRSTERSLKTAERCKLCEVHLVPSTYATPRVPRLGRFSIPTSWSPHFASFRTETFLTCMICSSCCRCN